MKNRIIFSLLCVIATNSYAAVEVAFSPNGGGEDLVVKTIKSAKQDLKVMAYSFTSAAVTGAIIERVKAGVACSLVADKKHNLNDGSGKAKAALNALSLAGCQVRLQGKYAIHHDKVIIADKRNVQTGSFNYSSAAESKNSENVIVLWEAPDVAAKYLKHFDRNFSDADKY